MKIKEQVNTRTMGEEINKEDKQLISQSKRRDWQRMYMYVYDWVERNWKADRERERDGLYYGGSKLLGQLPVVRWVEMVQVHALRDPPN